MRPVRRLAVCLALAAVAFPSADAWAEARRATKPKVTVQHASFLGTEVHVGPFGDVLVRINVTKTTMYVLT